MADAVVVRETWSGAGRVIGRAESGGASTGVDRLEIRRKQAVRSEVEPDPEEQQEREGTNQGRLPRKHHAQGPTVAQELHRWHGELSNTENSPWLRPCASYLDWRPSDPAEPTTAQLDGEITYVPV